MQNIATRCRTANKAPMRMNRQGKKGSQDLCTHEGNETQVDTVRAGQLIREEDMK